MRPLEAFRENSIKPCGLDGTIMTRSSLLPALCVAMLSVFLLADADVDQSAEVTLTKLQKGSVDHIIVAYGKVEAGDSATQSIQSRMGAVVGDIYVHVGQQVAKDAPLLVLRPTIKTQADYNQAKSAASAAAAEVERTKKLLADHLATTQQLADAQKSLSDARSTLDSMDAAGAGGTQTVKAPAPAIVTTVSVKPGANVAEGGDLVELAQQSKLVLGVGVTPIQADLVKPGDAVAITRIGDSTKIPGKVESRGSVVDSDDGLINVNISLPQGKFFLNEMAQAAIATAKVSGYVVPHESILVDDDGSNYVMQSDDLAAKKVTVKVLEPAGKTDVIEGDDLDPKLPLVVQGAHQLDDGAKMRLAEGSDAGGSDTADAADKGGDKAAADSADKGGDKAAADPADKGGKKTAANPADKGSTNDPSPDKGGK